VDILAGPDAVHLDQRAHSLIRPGVWFVVFAAVLPVLGACSSPATSTTVVQTPTPTIVPPAAVPLRVEGTFHSAVVNSDVGYVAYRPAGVPSGTSLPVVFWLPGRGGTAQIDFFARVFGLDRIGIVEE
jgi:hypothetical protein